MKRIMLLLLASLLLVACGSTSTETAEEPERPETAVDPETSETAVPEQELAAETEFESEAAAVEVAAIPGFPATTVQEASIVRDRDWVKGTDDPLVAIIEYGDFQ